MRGCLLQRDHSGAGRPDRCGRHQRQRDRGYPWHQGPSEDRAAASREGVELAGVLGSTAETGRRALRSYGLLGARQPFGFGGVEQVRPNLSQDPAPPPSSYAEPVIQLAQIGSIGSAACMSRP